MFSKITRTFRLSVLACIVILLLLAGIFALALHGTSSAFAAVLQSATVTCKQVPNVAHCDAADPEVQGCASSAVTTAHSLIVSQGRTIGRVERRYSRKCNSWWGRVYNYNPQLQGPFDIKLINAGTPSNFGGYEASGPPQFRGSAYNIFYSDMFFDRVPTWNTPEIIGTLPSNGDAAGLSATVPAAPAPAK